MGSLPEEEAKNKDCLPLKKRKMAEMMGSPCPAFKQWKPTLIVEDEDEEDGKMKNLKEMAGGNQIHIYDENGFFPAPFKSRLPPLVDAEESTGSTQLINSRDHREEEEEEKANTVEMHGGGSTNHRPYRRQRASSERGWLETSLRMGVTRPELYLTRKRVTRTDTDPVQHRFQLTVPDIENSPSRRLRKLGKRACKLPPPNGVAVKVMDRMGRKYGMVFKYIASSRTYRFMGGDYTAFLANTGLRANQFMDVWGLRKSKRSASCRF